MPVQCIYTLPVDDPYKKGYVYCTGVVITKKDRVGMALKMYFTDSGKKKESRYLRSLRKKIWYRNDEWKYDADIVARTAQKYYGEKYVRRIGDRIKQTIGRVAPLSPAKNRIRVYRSFAIFSANTFFGAAPICLSTICPFLMNKIVGMLVDGILHGDRIVRIDVAFADRHSAFVFAGQFVDDRSDHPAGAAPFGPEIDYQRLARIEQSLQIFGCDSKCHNFGIFKVYVSLWSYKGHNNIRQKHAATAKVINNLFNIPTGRRIHTYGSNSYISVYCNA